MTIASTQFSMLLGVCKVTFQQFTLFNSNVLFIQQHTSFSTNDAINQNNNSLFHLPKQTNYITIYFTELFFTWLKSLANRNNYFLNSSNPSSDMCIFIGHLMARKI